MPRPRRPDAGRHDARRWLHRDLRDAGRRPREGRRRRGGGPGACPLGSAAPRDEASSRLGEWPTAPRAVL